MVSPPPTVYAWTSSIGLIEEYEYPVGRAGADRQHVHRHTQICFSLDFPGRYLYRGARHDVPVGAVSVIDAWEPHACSDPIDRTRQSHYIVLYVDPAELRTIVDLSVASAIERPIFVSPQVVRRFRRLYRSLVASSRLEIDERYREFVSAVLVRAAAPRPRPSLAALLRARDFIAAHAGSRVTLEEIAAVADLTPWHFARAFHRQFGVPPHRFQLALRIDLARRLLADGLHGSEIALRIGFSDQSHFIRCFKQMTGMTPQRYQNGHRRVFVEP
jgi:AraC-like DNA-binding protein